MQFRHLFIAVILVGALGATASAQDTTQKPGGVNKVAHDVSSTMKKAGRDTKAEVKRDASRAHATLTRAGNDTKAELKRTTGVTTPAPSATHKPGGVNKIARDVSHASKVNARHAKKTVKRSAAEAHHELTKAGKQAKAEVKDSTHKP